MSKSEDKKLQEKLIIWAFRGLIVFVMADTWDTVKNTEKIQLTQIEYDAISKTEHKYYDKELDSLTANNIVFDGRINRLENEVFPIQ